MIKRPVFCIYGLGGRWIGRQGIGELDALIDRLPAKQDSLDLLHTQGDVAIRQVENLKRQGHKVEPLFIGHSMGCKTSCTIIRHCYGIGVEVPYFAAIDATALFPWQSEASLHVLANCRHIDQFWAGSGFPARARASRWRKGGRVWKQKVSTTEEIFEFNAESHIDVAENDAVRNRIVNQVKARIK